MERNCLRICQGGEKRDQGNLEGLLIGRRTVSSKESTIPDGTSIRALSYRHVVQPLVGVKRKIGEGAKQFGIIDARVLEQLTTALPREDPNLRNKSIRGSDEPSRCVVSASRRSGRRVRDPHRELQGTGVDPCPG